MLSQEKIDELKKLAATELPDENLEEGEYFQPDDMFGGNYDDAYYGGVRAGRIEMAREILDELGIEY